MENIDTDTAKKAIDKLLLWSIGWGIGANVQPSQIKEF